MRPAMRAAAGGACILTGIVAALALSGLNLWIPILLIPFASCSSPGPWWNG